MSNPDRKPPRRLGPRDPAVTSLMMSAVRGRDTKPELALRRALHARGARYRLHPRDVLGHPDLVVRSRRIAVFVDGDLWHGNPEEWHRRGRADLADLFPTRTEWWVEKIAKNIERDRAVDRDLRQAGWRVVRIWASEVLRDPDAAADGIMRHWQDDLQYERRTAITPHPKQHKPGIGLRHKLRSTTRNAVINGQTFLWTASGQPNVHHERCCPF